MLNKLLERNGGRKNKKELEASFLPSNFRESPKVLPVSLEVPEAFYLSLLTLHISRSPLPTGLNTPPEWTISKIVSFLHVSPISLQPPIPTSTVTHGQHSTSKFLKSFLAPYCVDHKAPIAKFLVLSWKLPLGQPPAECFDDLQDPRP